jgi:hypothetical protein
VTTVPFKRKTIVLMVTLLCAFQALAQDQDWVKRSNEITNKILKSQTRFAPEFSAQTGVEGFDEEIFD